MYINLNGNSIQILLEGASSVLNLFRHFIFIYCDRCFIDFSFFGHPLMDWVTWILLLIYNKRIGLTDWLTYQNSKVLPNPGDLKIYILICLGVQPTSENPKFVYSSSEKSIEKSMVFSINGKQLIRLRHGFS